MDALTGAGQWVVENYELLIGAVLAVLAAAAAVVKLTPTQEDDRFVARVQRRVEQIRGALARLRGRPRV